MKIFFDIDETLLHSMIYEVEEGYTPTEIFTLEEDPHIYKSFERPCAKELIRFAREHAGEDRVYILTTSTKEYANHLNKAFGWEFPENQIITREDINAYHNGSPTWNMRHVEMGYNILIENKPIERNTEKTNILGIKVDRGSLWGAVEPSPYYFQSAEDYYGINFKEIEEKFEKDVKAFIERHVNNYKKYEEEEN